MLEKKSKNDNNSAVLYYLKNFASFSKIENTAISFLVHCKTINSENKNVKCIEYIIDENLDENFFVPNLDLEKISVENGQEVLSLPLSCFEIYNIEEHDEYSKIRLRYLTKYKIKMLEHL